MAWTLVPSLVSLRAEIDALAPKRDRASDGAIGDGEHSQNSSDHNPDETGRTPTEDADSTNEVHAIDVDNDGPWPAGWSMERCVQSIVLRHRSGRDDRLQNIIYNRRIWSRTWGWTARAYTGANPHDHHAHFSARYTTAQENDTRPWGLLEAVTVAKVQEDDMELTDKIVSANNDSWTTRFGANAPTVANALAFSAYNATDAEKIAARIDAKVDQVVALLTALTGKDFTDETAIVAGVLAGLDAEAIAAAIPDDIARQVAEELHTRLAG